MNIAEHFAQKLDRPVGDIIRHSAIVKMENGFAVARWDEDVLGPSPTTEDLATIDAQPEPPPSVEELKAYAASVRYTKETGGIAVGGVKIATDETAQAKITGAYVKAARDNTFTTQWKGADGTFAALDAATILAVGDAVAAHVAACFATEASVTTDIASGKIKAVAAVDAAFA